MSNRLVRKSASWIALLAIVAVTFMPTLTRLWSAGQAGVEVCSADGSNQRGAPADAGHGLGHCPYCGLYAHLTPPPPPQGMVAIAPTRLQEQPAALASAPQRTAVWPASQPRAPPGLA